MHALCEPLSLCVSYRLVLLGDSPVVFVWPLTKVVDG